MSRLFSNDEWKIGNCETDNLLERIDSDNDRNSEFVGILNLLP